MYTVKLNNETLPRAPYRECRVVEGGLEFSSPAGDQRYVCLFVPFPSIEYVGETNDNGDD